MEEYMDVYDSLTKYIVYDFNLNHGGLGDCIKFFMCVLNICIKNNIKLYYLVNNISIEKYLRLRYNNMYITHSQLTNKILLSDPNDLHNINPNIFYIVHPRMFYDIFSYDEIHSISGIFTFTDEVHSNVERIFLSNVKEYISVHLRLGDKFLESDKNSRIYSNDIRSYSENNIYNFIEEKNDKKIVFFCDNHNYKIKIKEKFSNIWITTGNIGHTGLETTNDKQVLDTITEMFIMANSQEIYMASCSGFSIIAAKFNNVPLLTIAS